MTRHAGRPEAASTREALAMRTTLGGFWAAEPPPPTKKEDDAGAGGGLECFRPRCGERGKRAKRALPRTQQAGCRFRKAARCGRLRPRWRRERHDAARRVAAPRAKSERRRSRTASPAGGEAGRRRGTAAPRTPGRRRPPRRLAAGASPAVEGRRPRRAWTTTNQNPPGREEEGQEGRQPQDTCLTGSGRRWRPAELPGKVQVQPRAWSGWRSWWGP